ncbi:MAG: thioesterase family protein [Terriglobales bacterium]
MAINGFAFKMALRVRWAEVDQQGIVFNAHYLTYFDIGITEYWRAIGLPYPDGVAGSGSDLYVVKAAVNYHGSARYDDVLEVAVRADRLGNSSVSFAIEIRREGQLLTTGEVVYVNADPETRQAQALPARLRQAIAAYERNVELK